MSVIRKIPYIELLLGSMTETNLKKLRTIVNSGGNNVDLDFTTLTNDYKNDVTPVYFHFDDTNVKTAILIWTNSYCALICYHRFQDLLLFELNTTKHTYEKINEFCDINELRRIIDDTFEAKGQIDSGDANVNTVPVADGSGGAEWTYVTNAIKSVQVDSGDAISLLGFDSQGNVVKDTIPEGIVVDDALDTSSTNAIANKPVAEAIEAIDDSLADAYDSTATYNTGDYVIYENTLYKCKATSVTGTWDATKWDAVNVGDELNNKANKDGSYPTMSVGEADVAKNVKAYSDDSGVLQENPYISQGTGTNNNLEIVTTGNVCEIKSKNGNTISVNQLIDVNNINIQDLTNYSISGNVITFTATSSYGTLYKQNVLTIGHKYLVAVNVLEGNDNNLQFYSGNTYIPLSIRGMNTGIFTANIVNWYIRDFSTSDWTQKQVEFNLTDLTQWFNGNDNIPADLLSHPEHFSWCYNGSLAYNTGSLVNANGRYLECGQGRNLWDEETVIQSNVFASKNFIRVNPNTTLYFRATQGNYGNYVNIYAYDEEQNYIGQITGSSIAINSTFVIPSNAHYIKFATTSGTTYNHDITISLYYTPEQGGEGYDKYYPYVAPKVIDTGSEELLAFDKKTPDGTWYHNSGEVDLGTLNWSYNSELTLFWAYISDFQAYNNGICSKYSKGSYWVVDKAWTSMPVIGGSQNITIKDTAYTDATTFKTAMSGVMLQYELKDASKTTSQGTPFQAYPDINDYSYMLWRDTDNNLVSVPQGASIFYPVNYAGTLDDLVAYVDGDVTNLAKKSDITDTALNERGYYKVEDLSDQITDVVGLTYTEKHLLVIGNLITLTIRAQNKTGSAIVGDNTSPFFGIPQGYAPANPMFFTCGIPSAQQLVLWSTGACYLNGTLNNNDYLVFSITYAK